MKNKKKESLEKPKKNKKKQSSEESEKNKESLKKPKKNKESLEERFKKKFSYSFPEKIHPILGSEYDAGGGKRIMFVEWCAEWSPAFTAVQKKEKREDEFARKYYDKSLKYRDYVDLLDLGQKEQMKSLFSSADDLSFEKVLWCKFLVRPMNSGFCEQVKEFLFEREEDELKKLLSLGLTEQDLEKSIELFRYVVKWAKPDIILIFGKTLKSIMDYASRTYEENDLEELVFRLYAAPASVNVIPYAYCEKVPRWLKLAVLDDEEPVSSLKDLIPGYYDDNQIITFLRNEIKMPGFGYLEYLKKNYEDDRDCLKETVERREKSKDIRQWEWNVFRCIFKLQCSRFDVMWECVERMMNLSKRHPTEGQVKNTNKARKARKAKKAKKQLELDRKTAKELSEKK